MYKRITTFPLVLKRCVHVFGVGTFFCHANPSSFGCGLRMREERDEILQLRFRSVNSKSCFVRYFRREPVHARGCPLQAFLRPCACKTPLTKGFTNNASTQKSPNNSFSPFFSESPFVGLTEVFNEFVDEVSTEVEH